MCKFLPKNEQTKYVQICIKYLHFRWTLRVSFKNRSNSTFQFVIVCSKWVCLWGSWMDFKRFFSRHFWIFGASLAHLRTRASERRSFYYYSGKGRFNLPYHNLKPSCCSFVPQQLLLCRPPPWQPWAQHPESSCPLMRTFVGSFPSNPNRLRSVTSIVEADTRPGLTI